MSSRSTRRAWPRVAVLPVALAMGSLAAACGSNVDAVTSDAGGGSSGSSGSSGAGSSGSSGSSGVAPSLALTAFTETRIAQGTTASLDVHVTRVGMVGPITITVDGLRDGVAAAPLVLPEGTEDAQLAIDVPAAAPQGPVAASLNATAGTISLATPLPLFVRGTPGALDTTFGTGGTLLVDGWLPANLVVTSTGAIVVTGQTSAQVDAFALRVSAAGAVDATYGTGGFASGACATAGDFAAKVGAGAPAAVAQLKTGQLLLGGDQWVVRFLATGKVDPTFGNTAGCHATRLIYPDAYAIAVWGLAQRDDGDLFVGFDGVRKTDSFGFLGSTRVDPSGIARSTYAKMSYGALGTLATTGLGMAVRTDPTSGAFHGFFAIATADNAYGIVQETENGVYDASFSGGGHGAVSASGVVGQVHTGMAALADGSAIGVIPSTVGGVQQFSLVGFTKTGAPLATLGTSGVAGPFNGAGRGIVADAKGRLLVVVTQNTTRQEIRRFDAKGSLDTTFGAQGVVPFVPSAVTDSAARVAIAPDGRIVLLGQPQATGSTASLTRIWD